MREAETDRNNKRERENNDRHRDRKKEIRKRENSERYRDREKEIGETCIA